VRDGWEAKTLAEVCDVFADGDWVESKDQSPMGVRLIQTGNIGGGLFKDRVEKARYISEEAFTRLRCTEIFAGDCLISRLPDPVGRSCLLPETGDRTITAVDCTIARFNPRCLLPKFFNYVSQSDAFLKAVDAETTGTTRKRISRSRLGQVEIPVPPLDEQRRIVGILDEAFDGIAIAKANAERNLQNARAIFESQLQTVFAKAWRCCELVTLSDLAIDITDGDHMPPPKSATGVPFITIGNVAKDTRKIDFTNTFMVPRSYFNGLKPNKRPKRGDVLYTVTGSFGIPVILSETVEFCFQRHIGLVRPKPETNSAWLYYLLLSPQVFQQANDGATGTAQKTVSLNALRGFKVPKASPGQQQEAAAELDALSAETRLLESRYARKLASLEELKRSLLHQAFTGQLGTQAA
jgi:type I restriction enzyme S subunit